MAKALAGFHLELAFGDLAAQIGMRTCRAIEMLDQRFVNIERQIKADEVRLLHRSQDRHTAKSVLDDVVDRLGIAYAIGDEAIASRFKACCSRLPMKPGMSLRTCTGLKPTS